MKTCTVCGEEKPIAQFTKRTLSTGGRSAACKECNHARTKAWAEANKDKRAVTHRKSALKQKYGITPEQYDELFEKQSGCCAICERHQSEFNQRLAVDHNHKTREIRGLLCNYCNHRVVGRHTDGVKLRRIADYIEQGTGWFVPERKRPVKRRPKRG